MSRRLGFLLLIPLSVGCDESLPDINIFGIEDDKQLGAELAAEIAANPQEYGEILERDAYPEAYAHLDRIRDEVLAAEAITYQKQFDWATHIIHDDEVLNAFAAPGGYIYVYTGLIRFLDSEDHFAGVMGHEIAHADQRHSTEQLTKAYGISELLSLIFGDADPGLAAEVAAGLLSLEFSREDEAEADEYSVLYLCDTGYAANGAAGFFEKLLEDGGVEIPEFLSTHPSSSSRVEDINAEAEALGCSLEPNPSAEWEAFQSSLP